MSVPGFLPIIVNSKEQGELLKPISIFRRLKTTVHGSKKVTESLGTRKRIQRTMLRAATLKLPDLRNGRWAKDTQRSEEDFSLILEDVYDETSKHCDDSIVALLSNMKL